MNPHIIFFDDATWEELQPLTLTRPVCEIRTGIFTIRKKWMKYLDGSDFSYITRDHLKCKYKFSPAKTNIIINSSFLPDNEVAKTIKKLTGNSVLMHGNIPVAAKLNNENISEYIKGAYSNFKIVEYAEPVARLRNFCDIFSLNASEIIKDFNIHTKGRRSQPFSKTVRIHGSHPVFAEEGARAEFCTVNTNDGPVYLGKNAEIMEGCLIRGPFAICSDATLKMGAKIYGGTTVGPHCKVGGEVNNSVFFAYSNKAHDGFIGNSVIGEWVNIGADSNNSNLKNNYAPVKMWNYKAKKFTNTGLTFAGLIMGDHSKCSINSMFNTGTVIGVSCNLFGTGFHRNFVPSFTWGSPAGYIRFNYDKALEVAKLMMKRRELEPDENDKSILNYIYSMGEEGI